MKTARRTRSRRAPIAGLVLAATALGPVAVLPAIPAGAASNTVKVSVQTMGKNGKVLVANGKALYVLAAGKSCDSACLAIWPALTASKGATAGSGVQKSKLGTTKDSQGARQVTYNGKPVYWFTGDSMGTLKGNITDQWGKWTAVVVAKSGSSSSGSGSSSSSGGGSNAGGGGVSF
jgi:predicted lipoprotein with Yx(FWY)xxD motif